MYLNRLQSIVRCVIRKVKYILLILVLILSTAAPGALGCERLYGGLAMVVPIVCCWGWKCKVFSIVLEVFQLGALFPAAAFDHGDCIRYMDPFSVDLHFVRTTIVTFGYACWASLVVMRASHRAGPSTAASTAPRPRFPPFRSSCPSPLTERECLHQRARLLRPTQWRSCSRY